MNTLAERIQHVLMHYEGSQKALADEMHISQGTITQWKQGETKYMRPENLFALANATGFNPEWIGTGKGPKHLPAPLTDQESRLLDRLRTLEPQQLDFVEAFIDGVEARKTAV